MTVRHGLYDYMDNLLVDFTSEDFMLRRGGYVPQIAAPPGDNSLPPDVEEALTLHMKATDGDELSTNMQTLHAAQIRAAQYRDDPNVGFVADSVWYHQRLDSETEWRRALVKNLHVAAATSYFERPAPEDWTPVTVGITRHPYWEASVPSAGNYPISTMASVSDPAFIHPYTPAVIGTVPARLLYLQLAWNSATSGDLARMWFGLRSEDKHGRLADFPIRWECEDGTAGTDTATGSDSTASGGSKFTVTPGTATWAKRLTIKASDVTSAYAATVGEFAWLLRCKVSAGTWEVYLRWGFDGMDDDDYKLGEVREATSTNWDIINCGRSHLPPPGKRRVSGHLREASVQVWAQRTDGSGMFDIDCLYPVPIDEGYLFVDGTAPGAGTGSYLQYECPPDEDDFCTFQGLNTTTFNYDIISMPAFEASNFRLPIGSGAIVGVVARETQSVLTDTVQYIMGTYVPRWVSLRGNEA